MRRSGMTLAILAALAVSGASFAAGDGGQAASILDLDGRPRNPFKAADAANLIFFVATDCPISNSYAPEIQRICREHAARGVSCLLVYEGVDKDEAVKQHLREYEYAGLPVVVDRSQRLARQAKASTTPEALVIDRDGNVRYRGRIDNWYVALGKRRQAPTEHDLRNALDDVLAGRPVRKAETEALGCYIVDPAAIGK